VLLNCGVDLCKSFGVSSLTPSFSAVTCQAICVEDCSECQSAFVDASSRSRRVAADNFHNRSQADWIYDVQGVKFYLPPSAGGYSRNSLMGGTFQEYDNLVQCDKLLPKNPIIVDVGANIGNHSLYWAVKTGARKVIAFEPMDVPAGILEKNIELNDAGAVVQLHRIALSDVDENLSIALYRPNDLGKTQLRKGKGQVPAKKLDSIDLGVDHVDLVKIDVEGFELQVLRGARKTFQMLRPTYCYVEIWDGRRNQQRKDVFALLEEFGYVLKEKFPESNYLFELRAAV
jgi:FkbM family methyltransferase